MYKSKVLMSSVPIIYIVFIVCLIMGKTNMAYNVGSLLSPAVAIIYFTYAKQKTLSISLFLIFFSISDFLVLFTKYIPYQIDYFLGNGLYILAYTSLLFKFCTKVCVINVFKNFKIYLLVLTALNIYIAYFLQGIVSPHVSSMSGEYIIELIYNIVMLVLLSLSLLNYIYRDDKKSLMLFMGSLCIVFAEVIGVAYLYITNEGLLNFLSTTLYLLALYFFYWQSKIKFNRSNKFAIEEL